MGNGSVDGSAIAHTTTMMTMAITVTGPTMATVQASASALGAGAGISTVATAIIAELPPVELGCRTRAFRGASLWTGGSKFGSRPYRPLLISARMSDRGSDAADRLKGKDYAARAGGYAGKRRAPARRP